MKVITNPNKVDIKRWSDFVKKHPNGNVFQTPEMFDVYISTKNYFPVLLICLSNSQEILGILLAVIQKEHKGILGYFSARSIVFGGPLIKNKNDEVLKLILLKYNKLICDKVLYSQFRNFWDFSSQKKIFDESGFIFEAHLNILVDLTKPEDILWKEVHSKRRNEIRRSIKEGVVVELDNSRKALDRAYSILVGLYKGIKIPLPPYQFFLNLLERLKDHSALNIFVAKYNSEIIGCMFTLAYRDTVYDLAAGSDRKFYSKYPNDLIPWQVFLWAKNDGCKSFDFGGAGKPNVPYGVREYKKKFGGEIVEWGRFEKVHNPVIYKINKSLYKIWQKVF